MAVSRMTESFFFSNERILEDYLAAHSEHFGDLVVRRQPRTLMNGQPDILLMKRLAILDSVEIKVGSTCETTLGQVLDYAHWASQLTMEEVVDLAAEGRSPIDLPIVFEKRFGKPLPTELAGPPSLTLVASTFDRRTYHGIEYLRSRVCRSGHCAMSRRADRSTSSPSRWRISNDSGGGAWVGVFRCPLVPGRFQRLHPTNLTRMFKRSGPGFLGYSCGTSSRSASSSNCTRSGGELRPSRAGLEAPINGGSSRDR